MINQSLRDLNLEILHGMISDVESVRDCKTTLKLVTSNLKASTKFLKTPDLPEDKAQYWESIQLFSLSMLTELVPIVKGLITETLADARYSDYLALAETMSQIVVYLEKEELSEVSTSELALSLTPDQLALLEDIL